MGLDLRSLVHRTERGAPNTAPEPAEPPESAAAPEAQPLIADVASLLEQTRRERGLTLDQVSQDTFISRDYLEAFEGRAGIDRLPPPPYSRYFLREYARYLGLAEESVVESSPVAANGSEPVIDLLPLGGPTRRRWPVRTLVGVSVVALIALGVMRAAAHGPRVTTPEAPPAAGGSGPVATPSLGRTGQSPPGAAREIGAVLQLSAPTWIEATTDGKVVMKGVVPTGGSPKFSAKHTMELVLGNAGGVRLFVNGKPIPTGGFGQVVRLSFVLRNGRVVTA